MRQHEFAFDVKLFAAIRVKANTEAEARAILKAAIDCAEANLGAWPDGSPILCEVSLDDVDDGALYEVDGIEIDEVDEYPDEYAGLRAALLKYAKEGKP